VAESLGTARAPIELLPRHRILFCVIAGLAAGLGQVPFSQVWLALLGFAGSYLLLATARPGWQAFRMGWFVGTGYFAITLHWIVEPFLVDIARHGWLAPFAIFFAAIGFALFWGAAFALARALAGRSLALALALTGAMTLTELARGHMLTGFPWALPGYIWVDTALMPLAAYVGPYGLTLMTVLFASLVGAAIHARTFARAIPALVLSAALTLAAVTTQPAPPEELGADRPLVRIVQPNVPQDEKWDNTKINFFFHRKLRATAAADGPRPDLVVWPETSLAWRLGNAEPALEMIAEASGGAPVILGAQRIEGPAAHNSLAVIGADGSIEATYDKHHLVPFGEFIPLERLAARFGIKGLAARGISGYTPGEGPQILDLGSLGKTLPLICYEAIFPHNLYDAPERPEWLMQITNDAWFGETAGPQQHLAQSRMRAVEQGLPMVRSANTGISAMIDAHGRVTASLPLGEDGYIDARLPEARPPTLYARTKEVPAPILAVLLLMAGYGLSRRNPIDPKRPGS
jgi:apolipoprotein N-acyltransferase